MAWTNDMFSETNVVVDDMQNIEDNINYLKQNFASGSAPASPQAGQIWYNTNNRFLYIRNETNTSWVKIFNTSNNRAPDSDLCSGITVNAGTGLTGGGQLSGNVTLNHTAHTGAVYGSTELTIGPNVIKDEHMEDYAAGDCVEAWFYDDNVRNSGTYAKKFEFYIPRDGTVKTRMGIKILEGSPMTIYGKIYVNGTPVGTERSTNSSNLQQYDENFTVSAHDTIQIYSKMSSASGKGYIRCEVGCNNPVTITLMMR